MTEKKSDQHVDNGGAPTEEQTGGKVSNQAQEGGLDENALDGVSGGVYGGGTTATRPPTY